MFTISIKRFIFIIDEKRERKMDDKVNGYQQRGATCENGYQQRETEGRRRAYELISSLGTIRGWQPTEDPYCNYDVLFTGKTKEYVMEIKTLHDTIAKYPDRIMEKRKYDALNQFPGRTRLYMMLFDDGVVIWDMGKIHKPEWRTVNCTANTVGSYQKGQKPKTVAFLDYDDSVYLRRYDN